MLAPSGAFIKLERITHISVQAASAAGVTCNLDTTTDCERQCGLGAALGTAAELCTLGRQEK